MPSGFIHYHYDKVIGEARPHLAKKYVHDFRVGVWGDQGLNGSVERGYRRISVCVLPDN